MVWQGLNLCMSSTCRCRALSGVIAGGSSDGGCEQPRVQTKTFLRESVSRFLLVLFIYISETGEKYADSDWSVLISGGLRREILAVLGPVKVVNTSPLIEV